MKINGIKQFFTIPHLLKVTLISILFFLSSSSVLFMAISERKHWIVLGMLYISLSLLSYYLFVIRSLNNFWFLIKIVITYAIYQLLTYFIAVTFQINNADFVWYVFGIDRLERHYTLPLLYVIGLAFFYYWKERIGWHFKRHVSTFENFFISQFLTAFIITDTKFVQLIKTSGYFTFETVFEQLGVILRYGLLYIVLAGLAYLFVKGITDLFNNRVSISSAFSMSLLLALLFNYSVQVGISVKGSVVNQFLFRGAFSLQIILYTLLFLFIYLLTNRFLLSTIFIFVAGIIFSITNAIKFSMRNEPILPSDLGWIKQIGLVLGFVNKTYVILSLLGLIGVGVLYYFIRLLIWADSVTSLKRTRLGLAFLSIFSMNLIFQGLRGDATGKPLKDIPLISTIDNTVDIKWMGNAVNAKMKSLSYVWIKQMVTPVMEKPSGYNKAKVQEVVKKYTSLAQELNKNRANNIMDRTVIYVLSESFSDPRRLPGVAVSGDMLPYIDALKSKYTSGLMKSDGYGGGTANMEFQVLTGLPMYNMSSNISTIYTEVATSMRFLPSLSNWYNSENRVAVHLEDGANYSRNAIYKNWDYGKFIGRSNTDIQAKNIENFGLYPSDKSSYSLVLTNLEESKSQFFSLITMQNHVPWAMDKPAEISAKKDGFTDEANSSLTSYARLLNQTDQATKEFFESLSKISKKISVVFYGDHLPGFYRTEDFTSHPELQYQTDYFIWSNDTTNKVHLPVLNSSDLTAALLEATNSKVSPYYALLTQVMKSREMNTQSAKAIAHDLKVIEYDLLQKKGYLDKEDTFFNLGE